MLLPIAFESDTSLNIIETLFVKNLPQQDLINVR
jgi:hypothetical protein